MKDIIIDTAVEVCGVTKMNNKGKQMVWWTNEIKEQIKRKKREQKKYTANRTVDNYEAYKQQRKIVKELVGKAKESAWKDFGEKLERDRWENQKLFFRVLKSFRKEKTENDICIYNANGKILIE